MNELRLPIAALAASLVFALGCSNAAADAKVGQPAPAFEAKDADGKTRTLSEFAGKTVVLEWHNRDCPYVVKHYGSKNMQRLQAAYTKKGAVWLTVLSSKPGKQGHLTAEQAKEHFKKVGAAQTAVLLDPEGKMGKAYGAKVTPHMFVIDGKGVLRYNGAIDGTPSADQADIASAEPLLVSAADAVLAGKDPAKPTSQPYGCSVKY